MNEIEYYLKNENLYPYYIIGSIIFILISILYYLIYKWLLKKCHTTKMPKRDATFLSLLWPITFTLLFIDILKLKYQEYQKNKPKRRKKSKLP